MNDKKLWIQFSQYIRKKYANEDGLVKCFTCDKIGHWKEFDCGHGISRKHLATKYDERNNHPQCQNCNRNEYGKEIEYKNEVNKKYGEDTWEKLKILSRTTKKYSQSEINILEKQYKE